MLAVRGNRAQHAQHVVVYCVGCAPLGFLRGQGRVLARQPPGQPVGAVVGVPGSRAHEPGGDACQRHGGKRGDRLLGGKAAGRVPGAGGKDDEQDGDRHHQSPGPHRPGGGPGDAEHVGVLADEGTSGHGQDPDGQHQARGGPSE